MLNVKNNVIKLTRGDTAYITVPIVDDKTGQPVTLTDHDYLTFTVKKTIYDEEACFKHTLAGSNAFKIYPEDTSGLEYGRYFYDVQLVNADGDVYTVITPHVFEVTGEVTF